jgi:hypothetical protein
MAPGPGVSLRQKETTVTGQTGVPIAGAGPVGLTMAAEFEREMPRYFSQF